MAKEANKERIRKLRNEHTPLEKENALEASRERMAAMRIKTPEERIEFERINNKHKLRNEHTPLGKENALEASRERMAKMRIKTPEERIEFVSIK